jgi:hypothetical protein
MIKLIDHYHPERHYMRGPGPKWRERKARIDGIQRVTSKDGAFLSKPMFTRHLHLTTPCQPGSHFAKAHFIMEAELTKHFKIVLVSVIAAIVVVAAISAQL